MATQQDQLRERDLKVEELREIVTALTSNRSSFVEPGLSSSVVDVYAMDANDNTTAAEPVGLIATALNPAPITDMVAAVVTSATDLASSTDSVAAVAPMTSAAADSAHMTWTPQSPSTISKYPKVHSHLILLDL